MNPQRTFGSLTERTEAACPRLRSTPELPSSPQCFFSAGSSAIRRSVLRRGKVAGPGAESK
jgi:hypothetical protein